MTSVPTTVQTVSSSDWELLSGDLLPNNVQLDPTKGHADDWTTQAALSTGDCQSLPQKDLLSEFTFKFKHSWDCVQCSSVDSFWSVVDDLDPIPPPADNFWSVLDAVDPILPPYKDLFFHGRVSGVSFFDNNKKDFFKKPHVSTNDVGVQTMTTSIPRFPVACRSHPVPWGLDTDEPSPLVYDNSLDHNYTGKKRRLEDDIDVLGDCPPRKKLAFGDQDPFQLNHLFDFLKSPINDDVDAYEELVSETAITCKYEGLVIVDLLKFSSRVVSTNTMHIPKRREAPKCIRSKAWSHAAKQFLSEEDRLDKRGPRQGTREDRTNRMVNTILAYYCR